MVGHLAKSIRVRPRSNAPAAERGYDASAATG